VTPTEIYARTKKPKDLPWNVYVCRPLAALIVFSIAKTKITPNQVTLASAFIALIAALLLVLLPGHMGLVVAILVYELSYILDCVDGMLARLRNVQSIQGHLLDFLMDELKAFLILAAVAVRMFLDWGDARVLLVGLLGLLCLASGIGMTSFLRRPEIVSTGAVAAEPTGLRRVLGWVETVGHWLIHYPSYIWLAALFGKMELYLVPYVIVNAGYAARAFLGITLRFGRSATVPAVSSETHPRSSDDGAG